MTQNLNDNTLTQINGGLPIDFGNGSSPRPKEIDTTPSRRPGGSHAEVDADNDQSETGVSTTFGQ